MTHNKSQIQYLIITLITITLGILSRKTEAVPTFFGDALYAVMVYFGLRMLFHNLGLKKTALLALVFCFCIEFLQLYKTEWMLEIRRTTAGRYVLGQGFLWSDLALYSVGILIAFTVDSKLSNTD
jgi:glycopeptide antibiotics resistance protein